MPHSWTHATVAHRLEQIRASGSLDVKPLGNSFEGRPISLVTLGKGPRRIMAWSQMHGDEPTHTTVLLDVIESLATEPDEALLSECTLLFIPLLNPDGANRGWRFNAQGIDINRDARAVASPEALILRDAVLKYQPDFAFNLHNQNRRDRMVDRAEPVSVSLLAPPQDAADSDSPSVTTARQLAAVLAERAGPLFDGRVIRYGVDYMPRAFGEWVQSQGVATVLIEAGGWPGEPSEAAVTAFNDRHRQLFLHALQSIANDSYAQADPLRYLQLPRQAEQRLFDLLIHSGYLVQPWGDSLTKADLGINDPSAASLRPELGSCLIDDLGDLQSHGGMTEIDASGCLSLPGRMALGPDEWLTGNQVDPAVITQAIALGVTTLLLPIEGLSDDQRMALPDLMKGPPPAINLAAKPPLPIKLPTLADPMPTVIDWTTEVFTVVQALQPTERGTLNHGAPADIVVVHGPTAEVRAVVVGGSLASDAGSHGGRWLPRTPATAGS